MIKVNSLQELVATVINCCEARDVFGPPLAQPTTLCLVGEASVDLSGTKIKASKLSADFAAELAEVQTELVARGGFRLTELDRHGPSPFDRLARVPSSFVTAWRQPMDKHGQPRARPKFELVFPTSKKSAYHFAFEAKSYVRAPVSHYLPSLVAPLLQLPAPEQSEQKQKQEQAPRPSPDLIAPLGPLPVYTCCECGGSSLDPEDLAFEPDSCHAEDCVLVAALSGGADDEPEPEAKTRTRVRRGSSNGSSDSESSGDSD